MININISDVLISFFTTNNQIKDYIIKEFENQYLHNIHNLKADIKIYIYNNDKYDFKVANKLSDNIFIDDNERIMQIIYAKGRKSFVIYSKYFKQISVYIPYKTKNNNMTKITNPKYLNKWQNCLVDFLQGPFIGILEYFLLKNEHTFIHGSSFSYKNFGYVFCGKAQVGKTEIVKVLQNDTEILSDDFTILYDKQYICPYQKSIGVFWENINSDDYFNKKKKINIILEKINLAIFKILKFLGFKSKRIFFFKELFENCYSKDKINLKKIYFITRENESYTVKKFEKLDFIKYMIEILENEFNNLQNFWILLENCTNMNKIKFMNDITNCLKQCLENSKLFIINIPFFENKNEFKLKIKNIFLNILEEG